MNNIMPIANIPDWEKRIARTDAFWDCGIIDRPVVKISFWKKERVIEPPDPCRFSDIRDRWLDADFVAETAAANVANTEYCGDALPNTWPNFGPDVMSAFLGAELIFAETTSWSTTIIEDWVDVEKIHFQEDNFYFRKLIDLTNTLLEKGRGKFYTGFTDMHPGGDAIAALRGVERLNIDHIENPDEVIALREKLDPIFMKVFDIYYEELTHAGQPVLHWCDIVSSKKWAVISNDFSCMISKRMFDDVYLPGIVDECRHVEASLYHLDGPGALQHLDSLLEIDNLNAIQWVPGAGNGRASDWLDLYKRIQGAGKGLQISLAPDEIELFMQELRPEGVWLGIYNVDDIDTAERIVKAISKWR